MKLFLGQKTLEDWALGEKADLADGRLVVKETKETFPVTPAVHFSRLSAGQDSQQLLGRVKTADQLAKLGAEQLADSVVLGETAYEVESGYVTEVQAKADGKKKVSSPEADLLAAFILDKL